MKRPSLKSKGLLIIVLSLSMCSCIRGGNTWISSSTMEYAEELNIYDGEGYTVVDVRNSWDTTRLKQRYILIEKDSLIPANLPEGTLIRVPIEKAAVYASTHASVIEALGKTDAIRAVCEPEYISSEVIKSKVSDGVISNLGNAMAPSIEKLMESECEIIIASPFENSGYGASEKTGIPIIEAADYMENHPLGRTEWVKLYGLLFGCPAVADSIYNATKIRYNSLKTLAATAVDKPTVLVEKKYGSAWGVASAGSYIATIHTDAGADYPFMDCPGTGSTQLSYEKVYERACNADFWLFKYASDDDMTYEYLKMEYEPYANFSAFANRHIYVCNSLKNSYFDDITLHPDYLLEDLIFIYHPELLQEGYTPRYYLPLK